MERKDLVKDDLAVMTFLGVVVDIEDPEKQGRAKVRVFGKFDELADADLPWAQPWLGNTFGAGGGAGVISVPRKGAVVNVTFDNGNLYSPYFYNIHEPSKDMLDEIKGSYEAAHSLISHGDEQLKIFYTREK